MEAHSSSLMARSTASWAVCCSASFRSSSACAASTASLSRAIMAACARWIKCVLQKLSGLYLPMRLNSAHSFTCNKTTPF
eukprot:9153805-Pyramimonas_sp.AAC.1